MRIHLRPLLMVAVAMSLLSFTPIAATAAPPACSGPCIAVDDVYQGGFEIQNDVLEGWLTIHHVQEAFVSQAGSDPWEYGIVSAHFQDPSTGATLASCAAELPSSAFEVDPTLSSAKLNLDLDGCSLHLEWAATAAPSAGTWSSTWVQPDSGSMSVWLAPRLERAQTIGGSIGQQGLDEPAIGWLTHDVLGCFGNGYCGLRAV